MASDVIPAREMVIAGMTAVLPAGVPLAFTEVTGAHYEGAGTARRAVADVRMFDGEPARVAVWQHRLGGITGWAHEWLSMAGGAATYENGCWQRVADAGEVQDAAA